MCGMIAVALAACVAGGGNSRRRGPTCRSGAKVTLFEAEETCGGHTLTDSTGQWPVDLGFQVSESTVALVTTTTAELEWPSQGGSCWSEPCRTPELQHLEISL